MEIKSLFIYFIVFLFNLFGLSNAENININDYRNVESVVMNETIFSENGVKIQYNIKSDIKDEVQRIKNVYAKDHYIEDSQDSNHFYIKGINDIEIRVWREDDRVFVEGIIINCKNENSTSNLKKEFQKLQCDGMSSLKYFEYYKGKVNSLDDIKKLGLEENLIQVHNGYVGKSTLKSGERISYAIMEYNTGVYVIIGTPIIFATY